MRIARLDANLSVSPQIREDDIATLAAQGFRAIINNRPDGEADDQPASAAIAAAAAAHGLAYRHLPVEPGRISEQDAAAFAQALEELDGPVLAFCRSGTRSAALWALCVAGSRDADAILSQCREAGYDLDALRP